MTKRSYRHKILLDEDVHYPHYFPKLNKNFDVKHITEDYKHVGLKDPALYRYAVKLGRIIVTFNYKDFKELAELNKEIGVVGISANMSLEMIDKKLTALFRKSTKKSLLGKLTTISGESAV